MRIAGFTFDKISVEKLKNSVEELNIVTNIDILDLKELKSDILQTKEIMIQIKFSYSVKYDPGFALIELKGDVLVILDEKEGKELLKEWKKKQVPEGFRTVLFNVILRKSILKSLQLEEELNLPLHTPLPTISFSKDDQKDSSNKPPKEK